VEVVYGLYPVNGKVEKVLAKADCDSCHAQACDHVSRVLIGLAVCDRVEVPFVGQVVHKRGLSCSPDVIFGAGVGIDCVKRWLDALLVKRWIHTTQR